MGKHLVLVGGGHAHLTILKQLRKFISQGHRVSVVSPSPFHDYSGMGPGLLSGRYRLQEARFNIARMTTIRGGRFIEAKATGIDPEKRELHLDSGSMVNYDAISFNCGSDVTPFGPTSAIGKSIFPVKPVINLFLARQKIIDTARHSNKPVHILVIGGGPAGCEVAGNLQALLEAEEIAATITLISGDTLLGHFSTRARNLVRKLLANRPVRILENVRVDKLQAHQALLNDNRTLEFDFAFNASGISASGPFSNTSLSRDGNSLSVTSFLNTPAFPEIFGGGDCIDFTPCPLNKVGVYAVRQNPVLLHNLLAILDDRPLQKFHPQKRYLLIFNLGLGRAVATGYGATWTGLPALWLKNLLERAFMKKFQEIN